MKTYILTAGASTREVQARNKREAKELFKNQVAHLISKNDKIKFL